MSAPISNFSDDGAATCGWRARESSAKKAPDSKSSTHSVVEDKTSSIRKDRELALLLYFIIIFKIERLSTYNKRVIIFS